jgi:signal transduction histidine kinase
MIRVQCTEAELWFEVERPNHALMVEGERAKLRQIVLNLLSNAVKFTQRGGTISLKAQAVADTVELQVADTGIGMTPEDLKIAMTPFGQVDSALSRRYEGTGLGLPLTAALIELHAGTLQFDSEPDKGTRVTVTFPQMAAQAAPQTDALPPPRLAI